MNSTQPISPLTIIAIFAGIIEASALASLPFLSEQSQTIYTWFLVGFPFFLTVLFFLTLNFNHVSLYNPGPQDAGDSPGGPACSGNADAAAAAPPPESREMTIALSGPETRKTIETHILRSLTQRCARPRTWVLYNLDCRTCARLQIRPMTEDEQPPR